MDEFDIKAIGTAIDCTLRCLKDGDIYTDEARNTLDYLYNKLLNGNGGIRDVRTTESI